MPKLNFSRPPQEEIREFCCSDDPDMQPGEELVVPLRRLRSDAELWLADRAAELEQKYLTGTPEQGPLPIPMANGVPVRMSKSLVWNAATIEAMQAGSKEERYDFAEICLLSVCYSDAFRRLLVFAQEVNAQKKPGEKDGSLPSASMPEPSTPTPAGSNGLPIASTTSETLSSVSQDGPKADPTGSDVVYSR